VTLSAAPVDARLLDTPMQPLQCRSCGAVVQVRKSSWQQTSVQWDARSVRACVERGAALNAAQFAGCQALSASIHAAVVTGELTVVEDRVEGAA
jgi:hypothetical protein